MSKAVGARIKGDSYQALFFWLKACDIFLEDSNIEKIVYESNEVKSMDDVVIYYKTPFLDENNNLIDKDFYQVKFHVVQNNTIKWQDLIDPKFINASTHSFLKRLQDAHKIYVTNEIGCRFNLITPWQLDSNNELCQIISNTGKEINWDKLSVGKKRGRMWEIRKALKDHLDIKTDDELKEILTSLRIKHSFHSIEDLKSLLNIQLKNAGLKPITDFGLNPYVDLLQNLLLKNVTDFTKDSLIQHCKDNNLWVGKNTSAATHTLGIRSFSRGAENMKAETDEMICLLERFNDRKIINLDDWNNYLPKEINRFLLEKVSPNLANEILLDTHSSIAFLSGYFLDSKSGINIAPIQKYNGKTVWKPDSNKSLDDYPNWIFQESLINNQINDLAITIDIRHNIVDYVNYYIKETAIPIGRIINCSLTSGPGADAIKDGTHAWLLADKIANCINERPFNERLGTVHIFSSVPNGLMFFLGQLSRSFGQFTLYEYDFENPVPGKYEPSISFPLKI